MPEIPITDHYEDRHFLSVHWPAVTCGCRAGTASPPRLLIEQVHRRRNGQDINRESEILAQLLIRSTQESRNGSVVSIDNDPTIRELNNRDDWVRRFTLKEHLE